jgi:hypothetical protein
LVGISRCWWDFKDEERGEVLLVGGRSSVLVLVARLEIGLAHLAFVGFASAPAAFLVEGVAPPKDTECDEDWREDDVSSQCDDTEMEEGIAIKKDKKTTHVE